MSKPPAPGQPGTITCSNCGNVSAAGLPFCAHCGRPLPPGPSPYGQAQEQFPPSPTYAPPLQQQYPSQFTSIAVSASVAKSSGNSATRLIVRSIIGIVVVALIGVGVLLAFVFGAIRPIMSTGDAFMSSLRDGEYAKAFNLRRQSYKKSLLTLRAWQRT